MNNLKVAQQKNAIVNVYRVDEIFFTGYVAYLNQQTAELVLRTYDEWGMVDGMVYLDLDFVYDVEVDEGADLKHMLRRIQIAKAYHFRELADTEQMALTNPDNLRHEILGRSYVEGQAVMITLNKYDDIGTVFKCIVNRIDGNTLTVTTIKKNDFAQHAKVTVAFADINTIEFLGKSLTLLTNNIQTLFGPHIGERLVPIEFNAMQATFKAAKQSQQLMEIESKADNGYFYVGFVVNYNERYVVFSLVNMSGQFGGYVLMRLSMIARIETASDYLTLMGRFVMQNRIDGSFVEPVLNADRQFDMSDDVLSGLLHQAAQLNRLVRISQKERPGMLGYPLAVNDLSGKLTFQMVDDNQVDLEPPIDLPIDDIGEIAFDYLEAFFVDDALKNQRELK